MEHGWFGCLGCGYCPEFGTACSHSSRKQSWCSAFSRLIIAPTLRFHPHTHWQLNESSNFILLWVILCVVNSPASFSKYQVACLKRFWTICLHVPVSMTCFVWHAREPLLSLSIRLHVSPRSVMYWLCLLHCLMSVYRPFDGVIRNW